MLHRLFRTEAYVSIRRGRDVLESAGHRVHEALAADSDYPHRVKGNFKNANYWYTRIGTEMPDNSLKDELRRLYRLANAG